MGGGKKRKAGALLSMDEEVEEVKRMKVAELREALQKRQMDVSGRKGELVERLEGAIRGGSGGGGSSSSSSGPGATAQ